MGESVGAINVGLKARTKAFEQGMDRARGSVRSFGREATRQSRQTNTAVASMGDRFRKNGETVKYSAQQASIGLLQFTNQAGMAGKAAAGLGASMQGLFTGGLIGAGIAAVSSVFAILAEESRKAQEEQEKAAEKARQEQEKLLQRGVQQAEQARDKLVAIRREREDREYELALDRMEREAAARGEYFDRQLQLDLRASRERRRELRTMLGDELGGIAELEKARGKASDEQRDQLDKALRQRRQNVEALRREIELERNRPQQARDASAGRERAQQAAELAAAQRAVTQRIQDEAKARTDAAVALRQQVTEAARLANATDEERKYAGLVRMIREAEAQGLQQLASKARELLEYEKARAAHAKELAEYNRQQAATERVDKQLRFRERMADARTEKEREALQLEKEYLDLLEAGATQAQAFNTLQAEAYRRARERKDAENEAAKQLQRQLELVTATSEQERERIRRAHELADLQEKAGAKAVQIQQQLNALKDQQVAKEREAARAAKEASGANGVALGAGKYSIRADGTMDKGLARSRQARRNANRMRKYQRQERARRSAGRSIHDGSFSGLGGIRSGRRVDQQGPFSEWYGGSRGPEDGGGGGQFRGKPGGPGKRPGDDGSGPPTGPQPPKPLEPVVTGKPGEGAKGATPDFAKVTEDAAKAAAEQAEAVGKATESMGEAAEKGAEGAASAKDLAKGAEDLAKATTEQQEALDKAADAMGAKDAANVETHRATTRKVQELTQRQEQIQRDLETIQKTLSGAG